MFNFFNLFSNNLPSENNLNFLNTLKITELRDKCVKLNLNTNGTKTQIIERLNDYYNTMNTDVKELDSEDEDIESDNEEDAQELKQKSIKILFSKPIYSNKYYSKYICDAKDIVKYSDSWSYNRNVNIEHVNNLIATIKKHYDDNNNDFHFIGSLKYICDKNFKYKLIDGQHRLNALKKIYNTKEYNNIYIELECDVYLVDDLNDDNSTSIYQNCNTVKNITLDDIPSYQYIKIVEKLSEKFPKAIKDDKISNINYPNIGKKFLQDKLKDSKILELYNINQNQLYEKIINLNTEYKNYDDDDYKKILLKKDYNNKNYNIRLNKCKNTGFYLGLTRECDWINDIKKNLLLQ